MAQIPMHGGEARLTITATTDIAEGQFVRFTGMSGPQFNAIPAIATLGADGIASTDALATEKTTAVQLVPGTVMKVLAETGVTAGTAVKISADGKATNATPGTDDAFLIVGRAMTATASGKCLVLIN